MYQSPCFYIKLQMVFCSGGPTRTDDLQVMSLAGYHLPPPRNICTERRTCTSKVYCRSKELFRPLSSPISFVCRNRTYSHPFRGLCLPNTLIRFKSVLDNVFAISPPRRVFQRTIQRYKLFCSLSSNF